MPTNPPPITPEEAEQLVRDLDRRLIEIDVQQAALTAERDAKKEYREFAARVAVSGLPQPHSQASAGSAKSRKGGFGNPQIFTLATLEFFRSKDKKPTIAEITQHLSGSTLLNIKHSKKGDVSQELSNLEVYSALSGLRDRAYVRAIGDMSPMPGIETSTRFELTQHGVDDALPRIRQKKSAKSPPAAAKK